MLMIPQPASPYAFDNILTTIDPQSAPRVVRVCAYGIVAMPGMSCLVSNPQFVTAGVVAGTLASLATLTGLLALLG